VPAACRFLDARTRRCTVYEDRPAVCRDYPDTPRCGYWDFLTFERKAQDDPELTVKARVELSLPSGEPPASEAPPSPPRRSPKRPRR
jgi:Fe-S-cluster containining protein